eukprot:SAG22_NODE_1882_length_3378_cov_3.383959_3_plen_99_part_00
MITAFKREDRCLTVAEEQPRDGGPALLAWPPRGQQRVHAGQRAVPGAKRHWPAVDQDDDQLGVGAAAATAAAAAAAAAARLAGRHQRLEQCELLAEEV